jgi:hypothetical protein
MAATDHPVLVFGVSPRRRRPLAFSTEPRCQGAWGSQKKACIIDLNGRCAVVTGAAQGMGEAVAQRFVKSGAKVGLWDRQAVILCCLSRSLFM